MIYLTRARLMAESESLLHLQAASGEGERRSVCSQVVGDEPRYSLWISNHDLRMTRVAGVRRHDRQITSLRAVAVEQIHRTALVRYLRDYRITGERREQTLRAFYSMRDARQAVLAEHRGYLISASSQFCALELLEMTNDTHGLDMLLRYEAMYGHYFSMFCDRARAAQKGKIYLLEGLIPEIKDSASRLRLRILSGQLLPSRRHAVRERLARG